MKVWITKNWFDKEYEVWSHNDLTYDEGYYISKENGVNNGLIMMGINMKDAKSMFNLPRNLKKKEIAEGTMTFKVRVK